jgi:ABC-type antimicrobial peptide transport system permease subunit
MVGFSKIRNHKTVDRLASLVFGLVAIVHGIRIGKGLPLVMGDWEVPMGLSFLAVVVLVYLAVNLWENSK